MQRWLMTLAALVMLGGSMPARATTALYVSEREQAELSTAVVVATVSTQQVSRHPTLGRPQTITTVEVEDVLWGRADSRLAIHQLGGELDGQTLYVPGDARFEVGERCVLYVRQVDGLWYLTAMEQSKFDLTATLDGDILERDLTSGLMVRGSTGQLEEWSGDDVHAPTVTDLRALLQATVAGAREE